MDNKRISLTEATILALDGKLLTESRQDNWFKNQGLEIAKRVALKMGYLNCCDDIVNKVLEEFNKKFFNIYSNEFIPQHNIYVFSNNDYGTHHSCILHNSLSDYYLIDYSMLQFSGSTDPQDIQYDKINSFDDMNIFTNNTFKDIKTGEIYSYISEDMDFTEFIRGITNKEIVANEKDWIIYLIRED